MDVCFYNSLRLKLGHFKHLWCKFRLDTSSTASSALFDSTTVSRTDSSLGRIDSSVSRGVGGCRSTTRAVNTLSGSYLFVALFIIIGGRRALIPDIHLRAQHCHRLVRRCLRARNAWRFLNSRVLAVNPSRGITQVRFLFNKTLLLPPC